MKNLDKIATLVAIVGVIALAGLSIFVYKADGKDVTLQAITGLLGFAGGVGAGYYTAMNKGGDAGEK